MFSSCLLELFDKCCRCHFNHCEVRIASRSGTCITVEQVCNACNYFRRWSSQPNITFSKIPAGNLLLAGSIMVSGLPCTKTLRMFKLFNVATISERTFYKLVARWVQPIIHWLWKSEQKNVIEKAKRYGGDLVLAGDGRADSPGHCAKYGTYTIMEMSLNKVLDLQLVQVILFNCMLKKNVIATHLKIGTCCQVCNAAQSSS